jgi:hypothetical protein
MNNKSLSPNRFAGKFNYEQQVEHYKKNGMFIKYMARHYVVMGNAYDYVRVTFPEKPLKNFLEFREEAKNVNIDHITNSSLRAKERIIIAKSLALEDFIKNSVKKETPSYAVK